MLVYIIKKGPSLNAKEKNTVAHPLQFRNPIYNKEAQVDVALGNNSHESGAKSRAISPRPDFETGWFTTAALWVEVEAEPVLVLVLVPIEVDLEPVAVAVAFWVESQKTSL
jgi:hypothetical protein